MLATIHAVCHLTMTDDDPFIPFITIFKGMLCFAAASKLIRF